MEKYRIRTYNRIAPESLSLFDDRYIVGSDVDDPHGIIVRSARIDTEAFPSLIAVARAGAGVDNITVDKATRQGICVFNAPGANANAVAELVFVMAGIGARNIHLAIDFCKELSSYPDSEISKKVEEKKSAFRGFELAGKTLGVIASPHLGASTEKSEEQSAAMAAREIKAYLEHGTITHSVNFPTAESIPADNIHPRLIMINKDTPGMIGFVSQTIGSQGINIGSYLNESNGVIGYNIIDLEDAITDEVIGMIKAHSGIIKTRKICYKDGG